jgi:hypothetical protein
LFARYPMLDLILDLILGHAHARTPPIAQPIKRLRGGG